MTINPNNDQCSEFLDITCDNEIFDMITLGVDRLLYPELEHIAKAHLWIDDDGFTHSQTV